MSVPVPDTAPVPVPALNPDDLATVPISPSNVELDAINKAAAALFGEPVAVPASASAPVVADKTEPKPEDKPAVESKSLAELIREGREQRLAREREQTEAKAAKQRVTELEAELNKAKSTKSVSFEDDPIAYLKAKGISAEMQAELGQMLLYDLVPDKAPPDWKIKLLESKLARKEAEAQAKLEARKAQEEEDARQAQEQAFHTKYVNELGSAMEAFPPGTYPESEDWFCDATGSLDKQVYLQSLYATANNMAEAAARSGAAADLSPANVARVLEAELANRMSRRDTSRSKRAPKAPPPSEPIKPIPQGVNVSTVSTKGMNSGPPVVPAKNDKERLDRAAAALFSTGSGTR